MFKNNFSQQFLAPKCAENTTTIYLHQQLLTINSTIFHHLKRCEPVLAPNNSNRAGEYYKGTGAGKKGFFLARERSLNLGSRVDMTNH